MSGHKPLSILVALILLMLAGRVVSDPGAEWEAGGAAFASGGYADALSHFEAARDGGLDSPAVHYNIAVCQYALNDYKAARETFQLIARRFPSMQGLAEYNVGLAERRLGNPVAAQRQFVNAYRHSNDEKIKALAASQISELERETRSDWYGFVGLQVGHDDNVALRDSLGLPAGISAESPFVDLFASLRGPIAGAAGLELDSSLYAVTYFDAEDYDQAELRVGALYTFDHDVWRLQGGLYLAAGTLGGSSFNREVNLDVRSTRYFNNDSAFDVRLRRDSVSSAQSRFDGIEGSRSRLDLRYGWYGVSQALAIRLGFEDNDRLDAGVSPSRQLLSIGYDFEVRDDWHLESAISWRNSDYDDTDVPRSEDLFSAAVGLVLAVNADWLISGRYQYSKNDSTDPTFSYDRNQVTIGFQRLF